MDEQEQKPSEIVTVRNGVIIAVNLDGSDMCSSEVDAIIVPIDVELIRTVERRVLAAKRIVAEESKYAFQAIRYVSDWAALWVSRCDELEEVFEFVDAGCWTQVVNLSFPESAVNRMDSMSMIIGENAVGWSGYEKYSNFRLETQTSIKPDELRSMLLASQILVDWYEGVKRAEADEDAAGVGRDGAGDP